MTREQKTVAIGAASGVAATVVFVVARFAFWIGYRIYPLYRAFGMAATMYLNFGLLGWAAWAALSA